jgi:peptidoglycan/xylan/chitin deacetylase (PgdA/CDA1 family)
MYHSVSDNLFGKTHPYYQINTSPAVFAEQMRFLHEAGYVTVKLEDIVAGTLPCTDYQKVFVITFDDGYRDFYTRAFPILQRRGFTATMFLTSGCIQEQPQEYQGVEYLSWRDVRELHSLGIQIGSHTVSHPDLRALAPEEIEYQLACSKEVIEDRLGSKVISFAYPYAFPEEDSCFARFLRDLLVNQGYENGVTTILGTANPMNDPFFLPRLPVNSWDDVQLLRTKLEGGYDWLHIPQLASKKLKHLVFNLHGNNGSSRERISY